MIFDEKSNGSKFQSILEAFANAFPAKEISSKLAEHNVIFDDVDSLFSKSQMPYIYVQALKIPRICVSSINLLFRFQITVYNQIELKVILRNCSFDCI